MKINVEFEMEIPDGITDDHIQQWLEYELGCQGGLKLDNPLVGIDLSADYVDYQGEWIHERRNFYPWKDDGR